MAKKSEIAAHKIPRRENSKIVNNLVTLFFIIFFYLFLFQIHGYKTLLNDAVAQDIEIMIESPDLSYERKSYLKNRNDYRFASLIKNKTPEDAVILMPSEEMLFPEGKKPGFNKETAWGIKNKAWATYYLYPRKLIYVDELTPGLENQIEYVAIVNGYGYEYLNYSAVKKNVTTILPVSKDMK